LSAALVLAAILAVNLLWRRHIDFAEDWIKPYLETFYDTTYKETVLDAPFWKLLLPNPGINGTWSTTGFILLFFLEQWLTPVGAWYAVNLALITSVFISALALCNSLVFAATVALGLALSTFCYHAYSIAGAANGYPFLTFLAPLIVCHQRIVMTSARTAWYLASLVFLVLFSLSYEAWVDYAAFLIIAGPFGWLYLRRHGSATNLRGLYFVAGSVLVWASIYTAIRMHPTFVKTFRHGDEVDLVTSYLKLHSIAPAVDDVISNVFTFFFLTLATLIPPPLAGSISILSYNKDEIIKFMLGYNEAFGNFVYYHHVYMWRFYAGAFFTFAVLGLIKLWGRAYREGNLVFFGLFLLGIAVVLGSPSHSLIKFRPYNGLPFLGYKVPFSTLALYLLIGTLLVLATEQAKSHARKFAIVGGVFAYFFICAALRPEALKIYGEQTHMGPYPVPLRVFRP
jgi:hypothetical protein